MSIIRNAADGGFLFFCPGCERPHFLFDIPNGPTWSYNGNPNAPTFTPSILIHSVRAGQSKICHSYVTDGQIRFEPDSTHKLKGQTVPLPEWPYSAGG